MTNPAALGASLTAAERYFYADVMSVASTVGSHMIADSRQHAGGVIEVLARLSGAWITLDAGRLRTALTVLGQVRPGLTIVCDHGFRVDNLITALAYNREAEYDDCLIDGLLQVAILGTVAFDSPDDEQDNDQLRTGNAMSDPDSDLNGDRITRHHG